MNKKSPPLWIVSLFRFFCKEKYLEQIEGDLFELFERDQSRWRFTWNVIRFFRLRYIKGLDDFEQLTTLAMIKNYLKVALRALIRQKSYTIINISGLAIALASAMLISVYIIHESNYDSFHKDGDRLYKITKRQFGKWTPSLLAHAIREEIPQFEAATKTSGIGEAVLRINEEPIRQGGALWADQYFFKVFDIPFLKGTKETALDQPNKVVLTEEIAQKYFPSGTAMSEIIEIDGENYIVSGIIPNTPRNTHLPFKFVIANHLDLDAKYYWTGGDGQTYAKLGSSVALSDAQIELEKLYTKYAGPELIEYSGHESFDAYKKEHPEEVSAYVPHALASIHLDKPRLSNGNPGSRENINVFFFISIFILLIACINYINMSTARSTLRSKEVGIRKTLGSTRKNVIFQFLTESLLITFLSIIIGFGLATLSLNLFNEITLRSFIISDLMSVENLAISLLLLIIVGIVAGAYPAFVISNFNPITALKGGLKVKGKSLFRNGLVSFQFATSIFLIAGTLVIYLQVRHLKTRDLGIDISKTLVVKNGLQLDKKYDAFKRQLLSARNVHVVAKASNVPFMGYPNYGYVDAQSNQSLDPDNFFVEPGFEKILDIELTDGRFFKPNTLADTSKVIVNEALAKELGWEYPIGKKLKREPQIFEVIGVFKDFNYQSSKGGIDPMILRYGADVWDIGMYHQRNILVGYGGDDYLKMLEEVETTWNAFEPDYPFEAQFLDDAFNRLYDGERRFGKPFTTFSIMALLIAFLGLFSLTTFILQRRVKEIAVRKVMGASISSLLRMLLTEFTWLVVIGGIIGMTGAFYWLNEWLNSYTYRIELAWYILAVPIVAILILTWSIVSAKSYKAATSNPSHALKDE
ncbi:MAG: ABC transporter permease [Ekhidna sp.]|nr:ABC transporter permease [Ekhidna sp.]